jgi:hypothetical protein
MFLTNNSSLSKRNMKPALISGREKLYRIEDLLKQQYMTYHFFCGGEKEVPKEQWDRNALYFKIKKGE